MSPAVCAKDMVCKSCLGELGPFAEISLIWMAKLGCAIAENCLAVFS